MTKLHDTKKHKRRHELFSPMQFWSAPKDSARPMLREFHECDCFEYETDGWTVKGYATIIILDSTSCQYWLMSAVNIIHHQPLFYGGVMNQNLDRLEELFDEITWM